MKYKLLLLLLFVLNLSKTSAQIDSDLSFENYESFENLKVLLDKNYTFSEILNDTNLHFTRQQRISVKGMDYYWIKFTVQNKTAYDKKMAIWTTPVFETTLYFFDEDKKSWHSNVSGVMVADEKNVFKYATCVFASNKLSTFYIKVNVKDINEDDYTLVPMIGIQEYAITKSERQKEYDLWLATIAVVLAFLIYNTYWYFMFKEKVYLYYLITLISGTIYATSTSYFLSLFTSFKHNVAAITPNGSVMYIPLEWIVYNLSILFVIFGLSQLARTYLESKIYLPKWDKILNILFTILALSTLLKIFIYISFFSEIIMQISIFESITNLLVLLIILTILMLGIKTYSKKKKVATYFLLALSAPLLLILALVISLIVFKIQKIIIFLPLITILSTTISFAVALVARVNLIKYELSFEKIEKETIAASIAIEQERNLRLKEKIEHDKNEVAAAQHIKLLMKELHHRVKNNLQIVSSLLSLQSFRIKDQAAIDAVKEGQHRIEAMSLIHQKLYVQDNITSVNMQEFIIDIAESLMHAYGYRKENFRLEINVTETLLDVDKAIPLSIIINELITNAFKYAFKNIKNPELKITFTKQVQTAELSIADNGIGIDVNAWETNDGYGKELVQTFTEQLEGTLTLSLDHGTKFCIVFPF
uniref:histidine kinase dimerization/phosphoacceptor domain -containing protein n=1 Tax=Flavobacterium sp. TaxID=239 RepID=UPI0040492BF7